MNIALAAILEDILEEENIQDQMLLHVANVAATVILEMEEGIPPQDAWVTITVDMGEYRRMGDPCFGMHFRMQKSTFEDLVVVMGNHLVNLGRWKRTRTPLSHILMMVIWLLATPDSFRSVALRFGVRPGTLYFHYVYIIEALHELSPYYIKWPSSPERRQIKDAFQAATGFPGIVGGIDCTHVFVTKPLEHHEAYRNHHHSYSVTTQAIVDNRLLVRNLHVREVGSLNASRTFRRSPIYYKLLEDVDNLLMSPDEHLVGDGAYPILDFLMTPFNDNGHRTRNEVAFNTRLSRCRCRVEHCFGRCKGQWRRLKHLHAMNGRNVVDHITACFVLHNFTILHGETMLDAEDIAQDLPNYMMDAAARADDENEVEDLAGYEHPLLANAKIRGEEKRAFIVEHVISALEA